MIVHMQPQRIPLDHDNIESMLARFARTGGYLLHVETDSHGETIAYLERGPVTTAG